MDEMRRPTDAEVTAALYEHAKLRVTQTGARWFFGGGLGHSEDSARHVVRYCLMMGRPITDIVSAGLFAELVYRIADLEEALRKADG